MKLLCVLDRALRGGGPVLALALVSIALAACQASGPSPSPTGPGSSPTPVPTSTGDPNQIEHATGATDLVLRLEEAGGMLPASFTVARGPVFSLFGDGTAIFKDPTVSPPEPDANGATRAVPWQVLKLSESQVQALLQFAIGPGGLAVARARYDLPVADAPTATFTLTAGGQTKTVSVNGLGFAESQNPADQAVLTQLAALKARLLSFGGEVSGEQEWVPDRYRGILLGGDFAPAAPPMAWPWPAIKVADFVAGNDPNGFTFPMRTLTPAEAAAIGVAPFNGGLQNVTLEGPDGKLYGFGLRPLWPDETR
jgi:hypothetical protein